MRKKLVIWIIGGSSVGKTTTAKGIHRWLSDQIGHNSPPQIVKTMEQGKKITFTLMNPISVHIGELTDRQCSGTDTLGSKNQIRTSFEKASKIRQVIVLDAIMSTSTWTEFLLMPNSVLWVVLLDVDEKTNFKRLQQRRSIKTGQPPEDIVIEQRTRDNLASKLRNFRNLYTKVSRVADYATKLNTAALSVEETSGLTTNGLSQIIRSDF